jgi:hypothetical protein
MARLFQAGFDHITTLTPRWESASAFIHAAAGRWQSPGLRTTFPDHFATRDLASNHATLYIGAGVLMRTRGAFTRPFFRFYDGATSQVEICVAANGEIIIQRNETTIGSSGYIYPLNEYRWFEAKVVISDTVGEVRIRVDEVEKYALTGADTKESANAQINKVMVGNNNQFGGETREIDYDDVVINSTAGSDNNGYPTDQRVWTSVPNGAGASSQWTPSAGSNFQNVDDTTPNDDTDYNEATTVGDLDLYALTDLQASTSQIFAVQAVLRMRKTDAGLREAAAVYRVNSTNYQGAAFALAGAYAEHVEVKERSPDTGAAWTPAEINALQVGPKVIT